MSDDLAAIGQRIRLAREGRGLTRGQLGYRTGVSTNTIGRIERGEGGPSTHVGPLLEYLDIESAAEHGRRSG
jgi:transcriptional regulator with XRE-family HTH domain